MRSKRVARVDVSRCVACGACGSECPLGAVGVWRGCFARVDEARCVGCGKCARNCPADCIILMDRGEDV